MGRHFHSLCSILMTLLKGGRRADLGVGVVVVQRFLLRSWFGWNFCPLKGRCVDSTPRLNSPDWVQLLLVSVEDTEVWTGPGACSKSSSKSAAELGPEAWPPTSCRGCSSWAQGQSGWQKSVPQMFPLWISLPFLSFGDAWTHLDLFRRPSQPEGAWGRTQNFTLWWLPYLHSVRDMYMVQSPPSPSSCTMWGYRCKNSDDASQVSKVDFSIHSANRSLLNLYYIPGTLHVRCQDVIKEGMIPFGRWGKRGPGRLRKLLQGSRVRQTDSWAHFLNSPLTRVGLTIALKMSLDGSFLLIFQKRRLWLREGEWLAHMVQS